MLSRILLGAAGAIALATVTPDLSAQVPPGGGLENEENATWKCARRFYVNSFSGQNGPISSYGTKGQPWATLTHALQQTDSFIQRGRPVVIHLTGTFHPGLVIPETYPIKIPSRGLKLQGLPTVSNSRARFIGTLDTSVFEVDRPGTLVGPCGNTPPTEIRDIEVSSGSIGIDVNPAASGASPYNDAERVEITNCFLYGNLSVGVRVTTPAGWTSRHLIEDCDIFDNNNGIGGGGTITGTGILLDTDGNSSTHIRANRIYDHGWNIRGDGTGTLVQNCRPRIQSNFLSEAEEQVGLIDCSPWIVNNTMAVPVIYEGQATTAFGILYSTTRPENITIANNILWNEASAFVPFAFDVSLTYPTGAGGATVTFQSNDVQDNNYILNGAFTALPPTNISVVPGFVNGVLPTPDLHLLPASPLHDLGDNAFVNDPNGILRIPALPGEIAPRADLALDVDGNSRILDHAFDGAAEVAMGADERVRIVTEGDSMATARLTVISGADANGNIETNCTNGCSASALIQVDTRPNDNVTIFRWDPVETLNPDPDPDFYNLFQDSFGNLRVPVGQAAVTILASGVADASGVFTASVPVTGSPATFECEVYVQALSEVGGGSTLGDYSNRVRLEVNQ